MTKDILSGIGNMNEERVREMKLRYTPFMEMILAYGFLGLGLAAGPATVWFQRSPWWVRLRRKRWMRWKETTPWVRRMLRIF